MSSYRELEYSVSFQSGVFGNVVWEQSFQYRHGDTCLYWQSEGCPTIVTICLHPLSWSLR